MGTAQQTAEMGGGTAAAPVAGHYCAPERVARAPNVLVHRADPEARCSAEALLVAIRGAARGDEYIALLRGGAACRDAQRGARGRVHRVPTAAAH